MRIAMTLLLVLTLTVPAWGAIFSDITGQPAQRAIERLAAKGVVRGSAEGRFQPSAVVTRLELVLFLVRVMGISGQGLKLPEFKDLDQIPEDARSAVAASVGLGTFQARQVELKKGQITYTLTADKGAYGPEELILLSFIVTNTTKEAVSFEYANSQFHDFIIKAADGTEIARWSLARAFLPVDKPVPLAAGKSITFQTQWKQFDQNDNPVGAGRYEIIAVHTTKTSPTTLSLAFQKGMVAGYPDNTFRPKQPVSRAELAALLVRAGGLDGEAFAKAKASLPVSDSQAVLDWSRGSVAVAIERKMIPVIDGAFKPAQGATRADTAVGLDVLMTMMKRYNYTKGTLRVAQGTRPPTITLEDEKKQLRTYRVAIAHAVYRNDRLATFADLRPGDAIQMLQAGEAGDAVYIEATGR